MVDRPVERANRGVCRDRGARHDDFNLCEKPDEWQFQRFSGPDRPKCRKNDGAKLAKTQCANAASIRTKRVRVAQTELHLSKSIQLPLSRLLYLLALRDGLGGGEQKSIPDKLSVAVSPLKVRRLPSNLSGSEHPRGRRETKEAICPVKL